MANHPAAQKFIQSLEQLESTGDVQAHVEQFSEQCELFNPVHSQNAMRGREGAQKFWSEYLKAFQKVQSRFFRVVDGQSSQGTKSAILEWVSEGSLSSGKPIRYQGVSVLEFDEAGQVRYFRAYYDSAVFLEALQPHSSATAA